MSRAARGPRRARALHPGAWWAWALALAAAASRTTNPLVLALLVAVVAVVVVARRPAEPWARGLGAILVLGLVVIGLRVAFRALLGGGGTGTVLVRLPEVPLPDVVAGIRLGGAVTLEGLLAALYDGLRLAALLLCVGAANLLADARRLLRAAPGALYELGTAVVVAVTVAPQLLASTVRVRRARRLRGAPASGLRGLRSLLLPVLEDALDRAIALAAAMDSRGYGRSAHLPRRDRIVSGACLLGGVGGICTGLYGLLDGTAPRALGVPVLLAGAAVAVAGLALAGRRSARTRYRPDPWRREEWIVVTAGVAAAALVVATGSVDPSALHPSLSPLRWPTLPLGATAALLLAALPAAVAPPVAPPTPP